MTLDAAHPARTGPDTPFLRALTALRLAEASDPAATETARLAVYAALLSQDLIVAQAAAAEAGTLRPRIQFLDAGPVLLAFDSEERLADLAPDGADFVALAGRDLLAAMAGQSDGEDGKGLGLGVNLASPDAAFLLDGDGVVWLAQIAAPPPPPPLDPQALAGAEVSPPAEGLAVLAGLLPAALAEVPATTALLAQIAPSGAGGAVPPLPVLALIGPDAAAPAFEVLRALTEAARLAATTGQGAETLGLGVVALAPDSPLAEAFMHHGQPIARPDPVPVAPAIGPSAPGMDPARPPRLR